MQSAEFDFIADLLKKRSGLALTSDKLYLLESRLLPIARNHYCDTVSSLIDMLRKHPPEKLVSEVIEAMTTNESLFFRDSKPFDYFRNTLLPEYKNTPGRNGLRIWSAACSTGQEPYSISIILQEEAAKMAGWRIEIVGTDLAQKVVDRAKEGIYSQFEVQRGMPIQMLLKYFTQLPNTSWQAKDVLRNMVTYRLQNLLESYAALGKFDIIFCRNVLIYFDDDTKAKVAEQMAGVLNPGGYLFIGSTESLQDRAGRFTHIDACRGLYKLK